MFQNHLENNKDEGKDEDKDDDKDEDRDRDENKGYMTKDMFGITPDIDKEATTSMSTERKQLQTSK